ncbi:hypothetical protein CEE69_25845 [Rhodopirellula bahusiensis]|uniref:Uncharacterized protein n=1 Tax=Rhodopirellula bahusiensis TaxID=2014065 RepID=A0A2G1W117_9BACT|nr:hypothetical protein CEE69_25845 [Rhodopirellula bahusiensis]
MKHDLNIGDKASDAEIEKVEATVANRKFAWRLRMPVKVRKTPSGLLPCLVSAGFRLWSRNHAGFLARDALSLLSVENRSPVRSIDFPVRTNRTAVAFQQ